MKNTAEHLQRVRRLYNQVKKEGGSTTLPPVDEPIEQLLRGVLSDYAAEARASSALSRLRTAVVDLNELRVTPVSEMVEIIGADYPMCRKAMTELSAALNAVYNKLHHLDLSFLKKCARRSAEAFIHSLEGVNAHARATVILRCFKGHAVPVDAAMFQLLRRTGCVEPDASVDQAQKFLAAHLRESEAIPFYVLMKRYAAAHAPRKGAEPEAPPPAQFEGGETVHAERNSDSIHSAAKEKKAAPAAVVPRKPEKRQAPRKRATSAAKKRRPPARRKAVRRHR
jgi:endonuclease III